MVLYGASGHAKVVIDILEANHIPIDYIVDDDTSITELFGYSVEHECCSFDEVFVAIGACQQRKAVVENITAKKFTIAIHPSAIISPRASIKEGTVVMQGAIIQSEVLIGKHCIINTGASVDHECKIEDFVHISPHATLCGNVSVGECSWIGAGAVIRQGIKIGSNCMIGAGAVVVKDVTDGDTVVGNPARILIRKN